MEKFNFLLGDWQMKYTVPESELSEAEGTFKRTLDDKYVFFDYKSGRESGPWEAHGVFAKDEKHDIYRYWWFENSGTFLTATCNFVNDTTLFMNWHDTLLIQTFELIKKDYMVLKMSQPTDEQNFQLILKVEFFKK